MPSPSIILPPHTLQTHRRIPLPPLIYITQPAISPTTSFADIAQSLQRRYLASHTHLGMTLHRHQEIASPLPTYGWKIQSTYGTSSFLSKQSYTLSSSPYVVTTPSTTKFYPKSASNSIGLCTLNISGIPNTLSHNRRTPLSSPATIMASMFHR